MDYVSFTMQAGKDIVKHMMPKEEAEKLVRTAKEVRKFQKDGKHYIEADGYTFQIRKPSKGGKDVLIL